MSVVVMKHLYSFVQSLKTVSRFLEALQHPNLSVKSQLNHHSNEQLLHLPPQCIKEISCSILFIIFEGFKIVQLGMQFSRTVPAAQNDFSVRSRINL